MRKEESMRPIYEQVDAIYRSESRCVFCYVDPLVGDFDPGEEAVQTAVCRGVGAVATGGSARRGWFPREVQSDRRVAAEGATVVNYGIDGELEASPNPIETDQPEMEDDRLRLIFTCCHPALPPDAPNWRWRCERCAAGNRTVEVLGDSPRRLSSPAGRRILRRTHPRKQAEELVDHVKSEDAIRILDKYGFANNR